MLRAWRGQHWSWCQRYQRPGQPRRRLHRRPFLELGDGAERWLILAAASGAERIRTKIRRATELAALVGSTPVDGALGLAAAAGRLADGDLESLKWLGCSVADQPQVVEDFFRRVLSTVAVDRRLHHAHVIVTEGQSHRLTEALDGRGVMSIGGYDRSTT
jgi:hypothetical protein